MYDAPKVPHMRPTSASMEVSYHFFPIKKKYLLLQPTNQPTR